MAHFCFILSFALRLDNRLVVSKILQILSNQPLLSSHILVVVFLRVSTVDPFQRECLTCSLFKSRCTYYDSILSPNLQHVLLNCRGNVSWWPKQQRHSCVLRCCLVLCDKISTAELHVCKSNSQHFKLIFEGLINNNFTHL